MAHRNLRASYNNTMENKEVNNTGQTLPNPTEYTTRKEYKRIFNSDIPYLRNNSTEYQTKNTKPVSYTSQTAQFLVRHLINE